MFLAPDALQSLTMEQVEELCEEAGLTRVDRLPAPDHGSPTVVYRKPDEEAQ